MYVCYLCMYVCYICMYVSMYVCYFICIHMFSSFHLFIELEIHYIY